MEIDRAIVVRHWEQAAVEQLTKQLVDQGYTVERNASLGNTSADIVARHGDTVTVFEVKVPGQGDTNWSSETAALRDQARALGGRFQLVLVRPPRETRVEIDGLESALRDELSENVPPELDALSANTMIDDVNGIQISSLAMHGATIEIEGEATVTVTLHGGDKEASGQENFPFSFRAALGGANRIEALADVRVDVSSWYGEETADPAASSPEDEPSPDETGPSHDC